MAERQRHRRRLSQSETRQKKRRSKWSLCLFALFMSSVVWGQEDAAAVIASSLKAAILATNGTNIEVVSVEPAEPAGLFRVILSTGEEVYALPDGSAFIVGDLLMADTGELVNVDVQRREAAQRAFDGQRRELMASVPLEQMIIFSPSGETKDYINVFTDVTCGYCRRLHNEVAQLNDLGIEVRYLAYPRSGLGTDGARLLETAWCSDDPQTALTEMKAGARPALKSCAQAPVSEHFQLGQRVGVNGTPAIVTSTGQLIPGYRPAADLAAALGIQ